MNAVVERVLGHGGMRGFSVLLVFHAVIRKPLHGRCLLAEGVRQFVSLQMVLNLEYLVFDYGCWRKGLVFRKIIDDVQLLHWLFWIGLFLILNESDDANLLRLLKKSTLAAPVIAQDWEGRISCFSILLPLDR